MNVSYKVAGYLSALFVPNLDFDGTFVNVFFRSSEILFLISVSVFPGDVFEMRHTSLMIVRRLCRLANDS